MTGSRADAAPDTTETASDAPEMARGRRLEFERLALPVIFVAVIALFSFLPQTGATFHTSTNVRNLLSSQAVPVFVALAIMLPILGGQFDISVGSNLGFCAIVAGALESRDHTSLVVAVVVAIAAGTLVGCINGLLVAYVGLNSLIATIGMQTVLAGIVSLYSHDETIADGLSPTLLSAGTGDWLGIPKPIWYAAVAAIVLGYLLAYTPFGRYLQAIGANAKAARLVGLRVPLYTFSSFVLAGALAGIAGVLQLAQSGSASPQVGPGLTLVGLSAVFLGSTTWRPGRFNIPGTVLAVFFVAVIVNGLVLAGTSDWVQSFFDGIALLGAVTLSIVAQRRKVPNRT